MENDTNLDTVYFVPFSDEVEIEQVEKCAWWERERDDVESLEAKHAHLEIWIELKLDYSRNN